MFGLMVVAVICAVGGAIVGTYAGVALRACLRPPRTQQIGARWGALWGLLVAGGVLAMRQSWGGFCVRGRITASSAEP